ncbi:ankyrin repeat domain-containing protein [Lignipirellula cremea]|uniref:Ankyrin repeats (3 copies) n=1 Tax=Lignipirellula cremea TaxID=2528010 RepID=A0A518E342_9BACT|nr:ankyrin repeat domain-containing protein [Lignipirellula cremea]QDU98509.1 Ankyrin repeats (3 copies) [Lignipirellula cremea]
MDENAFYDCLEEGDVVRLRGMIDDHPDITSKFRSDPTALKRALINEATAFATIRLLVENGFDVNLFKKKSLSPLSTAVSNELYEVTEYLLKHGARTDLDRVLITAINCREHSSRKKFVELLLRHAVDVNQVHQLYDTDAYFSALDWAKSDPKIADLLRRHGAKSAADLQG